jgi:hypothetical protein
MKICASKFFQTFIWVKRGKSAGSDEKSLENTFCPGNPPPLSNPALSVCGRIGQDAAEKSECPENVFSKIE